MTEGRESLFAVAPALDLRAFLAREAPEHLPTLDDLVHRTADAIRDKALVRDIRSVLDDYSDSRIDSLVAVGKIGLRLYAEPSS